MERLSGKRIIITGAVSNIGLAAVERLIAEGARVFIGDHNHAVGTAVAKRLGDQVRFVPCDVTNEESVAALVRGGVDLLGGLDGVCQNAGVQHAGRVTDFPAAKWDETFLVTSAPSSLARNMQSPISERL